VLQDPEWGQPRGPDLGVSEGVPQEGGGDRRAATAAGWLPVTNHPASPDEWSAGTRPGIAKWKGTVQVWRPAEAFFVFQKCGANPSVRMCVCVCGGVSLLMRGKGILDKGGNANVILKGQRLKGACLGTH
jgi:hypothetical protein